MQAEASVNLILKILCGAVKARYEQHPHARRLRRFAVEIDKGLVLLRPDEEDGRFRDFHEDQMARPDVRAALAKAADRLKASLPPGAFPFRIEASIELYVARSEAKAQAEDVEFSAAGIRSNTSYTSWSKPLERLTEKLELLHEREAETMDKHAYYIVRKRPDGEGFSGLQKFYASSPTAARDKALMIESPADAKRLFSGAVSSFDERVFERLDLLHVCPAGPSLADLLKQQDNAPSPA
ncbi:hypothetical protein [Leisingera caerulea]|uniref:hypothetical protein n=1 Tax=Leisingera caerulea TaxID=506591 RepID=UPI0004827D86|nr:hypothetical protein [Leisingera caerulea]